MGVLCNKYAVVNHDYSLYAHISCGYVSYTTQVNDQRGNAPTEQAAEYLRGQIIDANWREVDELDKRIASADHSNAPYIHDMRVKKERLEAEKFHIVRIAVLPMKMENE